MKVDLLMWTRNGAKTLPQVLDRINMAVPSEIVNRKLAVDDGSRDNSRQILRQHGWAVFDNRGGGIANGANFLLGLVGTEYFLAFEQDILLPTDWLARMKEMVGVADVVQGKRFSQSKVVRAFEELQEISFGVGSSMDNNLFRTSSLRDIGGFGRECPVCVDANTKYVLGMFGKTWVVNSSVVSVHLHGGFWGYLRNQRKWWTQCTHSGLGCHRTSFRGEFKRFLFSSVRGLQIAWQKRDWRLLFAYPVLRAVRLYYTVRYRRK